MIEWIQNAIWEHRMVLIVFPAVFIVPYLYALVRHIFLGKKAPDSIYLDIKKFAEKTAVDRRAGRPISIPENYRIQNSFSWENIRKILAISIVYGVCAFALAMLGFKFFPQQTYAFLGITKKDELVFVYTEDRLENHLVLKNITMENSLEFVSFSALKENIREEKNYYGAIVLEIDRDDKDNLNYLLASEIFSEDLKTTFMNEFNSDGCVLLSATATEKKPINHVLVTPRSDKRKFSECVRSIIIENEL